MFTLILVVMFLFAYSSLSSRIRLLESKVRDLSAGDKEFQVARSLESPRVATEVASSHPTEKVVALNQFDATESAQNAAVPYELQLVNWLKEDVLLKVGAFLVIIAFAWLAVYTLPFIGPVGRIVAGLLVGSLITAFGVNRMKQYTKQGAVFMLVGVMAMLSTLFADQALSYGVFSVVPAMLLMFAVSLLVSIVGVSYKQESLAFTGVVFTAVVPLLVSSGLTDYVLLYSYLLLLVLASIWIVFVTDWVSVLLASITVVIFYTLPFLNGYILSEGVTDTLSLLACVFAMLFYVTSLVIPLRRDSEDVIKSSAVAVTLNSLFVMLAVMSLVDKPFRAVVLICVAFLATVAAYLVFSYEKRQFLFISHVLASLSFVGVATSLLLEGPSLTIAYILEVALCIVCAVVYARKTIIIQKVSLLAILPILLSVPSFSSSSWDEGAFNQDAVVLLLIIALAYLIGRLIKRGDVSDEYRTNLGIVYYSASGFYAASLLWLVLHAGAADQAIGTFIALTIYTLVGVGYYFVGKTTDVLVYTKVGFIVIGSVIARLLLVDVWSLETSGRVVTFFVLGAIIMSTAFFRKK